MNDPTKRLNPETAGEPASLLPAIAAYLTNPKDD